MISSTKCSSGSQMSARKQILQIPQNRRVKQISPIIFIMVFTYGLWQTPSSLMLFTRFCDVSVRCRTEVSGKLKQKHTHSPHSEKHIMCQMFVKVNEINVQIKQCYFAVITSDKSVCGECSFVFHRRKLLTDLNKSIFLLIYISSFLFPFLFIPMNSIPMSMRQTTLSTECCPNALQHKD